MNSVYLTSDLIDLEVHSILSEGFAHSKSFQISLDMSLIM